MKRRRSLLLFILLVLLLIGGTGLWLRQSQRQYALNRELIAALVKDDTGQALALVNAGADPNTPLASTPPTPLQMFTQLLRRSPPPVNDGPTAFVCACAGRASADEMAKEEQQGQRPETPQDVALVQAMLAHGANVHAHTSTPHVALVYAACNNHVRTVELLLKRGISINAQNSVGMTLLEWAAMNEHVPLTRLLLAHGADVRLQDKRTGTALHYAVVYFSGDKQVIQMLLERGADPHCRNANGQTPLLYAQKLNRPDIVALLQKGGG